METLIVIVLLGILAVAGFPRIANELRHQRVINAANVVAADLEEAFSLAARQRKPVRISYSSGGGELQVTDRATGSLYRRRPLGASSEYSLTNVRLTPDTVIVFPNGVSSAALTIDLASNSYQRRVTTTPAGLVRVFKP
jgi:Tfp pilus assembly protein FimT